jgi:hypothetical protein
MTAKLTANLIGHHRHQETAVNVGETVELHGRTAADDQGSAGQS